MDETQRLICCVCGVGAMKNFPNNDYLCSKVCEKVFLVTQGLVLGNILQSIFRDICDVKFHPYKTERKRRVFHVWQSSERNDSGYKSPDREERTNISATSNANLHYLEHSEHNSGNVNLHHCHKTSSQLQSNQGDIQPEVKSENTKDLTCDDQLCEDGSLPSDRESDAPGGMSTFETVQAVIRESDNLNEVSTFETVQAVIRKSDNLKTRVVVTATYKNHSPEKKRQRKKTSAEDSEKGQTKSQCRRLRNNGKPKEPVTSQKQEAVSEICERKFSGKPKSQQEQQNQLMKTNITAGRSVKCKHCSKMISKSYMYIHFRAMHKDHIQDISISSLSCSECGKLFLRKQALNAHKLKLHHHKFSIICSHCGKGFVSRFGLSWHMRQVHKVTVRQCGTCGETFDSRRDYKKHRRNQHSTSRHVCHVCGKGFTLKTALQAHLDAHAGVKLHFCEVCGDGFVRFSSLYQHKNNVHGPKKSELPFRCQLCPSAFKLQSWLEKHIQKHQETDQEKADCKMCQDFVKTSAQCPVHGSTAKETLPCPHCEKVFGKQTNLKAHMKRHQEPKFSCDVCQKKFTYKCNMLRHRETHNSEKPHHCNICAKHFCSKFLLASHMRMHNQDLFKCAVCGKGLTRKDYLKNHMKKMHPEIV